MPILVQWKWVERTKTFLVIFHFYDNYSQPNLRIRKMEENEFWKRIFPQKEACMTWAPSHIELGLLGELLRYANIIDGLNESEKREFKGMLTGDDDDASWYRYANLNPQRMLVEGRGLEPNPEEPALVVELCQEYVDYLRKILEPYTK